MKKLLCAILLCMILPCRGGLTQEEMVNEILDGLHVIDTSKNIEKALTQMTLWQDKLDINTYSRAHGTSLLNYAIYRQILHTKLDQPYYCENFKTLYAHIIKLFKNKININTRYPNGTVLHSIINTMINSGSCGIEDIKKTDEFFAAFVTEFKDTIDFTVTDGNSKNVFDLCAVSPIQKNADSCEIMRTEKRILMQKAAEQILLKVYFDYQKNIKK